MIRFNCIHWSLRRSIEYSLDQFIAVDQSPLPLFSMRIPIFLHSLQYWHFQSSWWLWLSATTFLTFCNLTFYFFFIYCYYLLLLPLVCSIFTSSWSDYQNYCVFLYPQFIFLFFEKYIVAVALINIFLIFYTL